MLGNPLFPGLFKLFYSTVYHVPGRRAGDALLSGGCQI